MIPHDEISTDSPQKQIRINGAKHLAAGFSLILIVILFAFGLSAILPHGLFLKVVVPTCTVALIGSFLKMSVGGFQFCFGRTWNESPEIGRLAYLLTIFPIGLVLVFIFFANIWKLAATS